MQTNTANDFNLIQDKNIDGYHYLDFLAYHSKYAERDENYIRECIDFVREEQRTVEVEKKCHERRINQLKWYENFLKSSIKKAKKE